MILRSTEKKFETPVKGFNSLEDAIQYIEPLELPLPKYSHQFPVFPIWTNRNRKIQGQTINLFLLSCTCEVYKERELKYFDRDIRKTCIHLYYGFERHRNKILDDLSKLLLDQQYKYGVEQLYKLDDETFLGTKPGSEWIKIYKPRDSRWTHYSYNRLEKRFSYDRKPTESLDRFTTLFYNIK